MTRFNVKTMGRTSLLLMTALPALAEPYAYSTHVARQEPPRCILDSLVGRVGQSSGGRKVGIVMDASGSMETNDPSNLRLVAASALNDALISQSEATGGQTADLVTVVRFSGSSSISYPLSDPSGANSFIDSITLDSTGTAIGTGIQAAIEELTAPGNDPTANRTGIVVFTDGEDYPASGKALTISETQRAGSLGIRVSFGFLTITPQSQDIEILRAILQSGGVYATIDQAATQQAFVALALANGLTGLDATGANATTTLLPGISTAKFFQTGTNTFTYAAQAGETFNVTVEAIDPIALTVTLRDVSANTDLISNTTDSMGVAVVPYTAQSAMDVEVVITASNASTGIFSVGLNSSIPLSDTCNITSPPAPGPSVYPGAAVSAHVSLSNLFAALTSILGLAVAAAML